MDASAVLAKIIPDQATDPVFGFWNSLILGDELVAPPLLLAECTSVLRTQAYERVLDDRQAASMLDDLLKLPISLSDDRRVYTLAFDIAQRTRRKKAYDMQYVAVAVLERCEMVTLDGGVYQAAREQRIDAGLLR